MTWFRYIAAYLLWGVFSVASYAIGDVLRQAAFAITIVLSNANPYVVRLFDRVFFVFTGMVWLGLVVLMESVFRQSAQRGQLSMNAANTLAGLAALLVIAQSVYMRYTPNSQTQSNIAIRDGAVVVLLVGIISVVLLRWLRAPAHSASSSLPHAK